MNVLDIGIILILIMCAITGFKKGVIKEAVSFAGLIIVFIIAFIFKESLGNFLCKYLPFFSFGGTLKGMVAINILIYQLIAFIIIYSILSSIYVTVLKLSGVLQKIVNLTIIFALPSKIAGSIISILEGYLIIFIVLLVLMIPLKDNILIKNSVLANKIVHNTPVLSNATGSITNSINEIYTLGDQVANEEITTNQANLKTIEIMLKHKVVTPKTVEQLIVLDKLKTVKGIDKIIIKYQ